MWIHEGFTTYAETVFVECMFGYEKAMKYSAGQRASVANDKPVIGIFGVNKQGSGDMYYKGALMLNTLRHIINNDDKWWAMLLKYSETYKKQIIDTDTVIAFFSKESGMDLKPFFEQYLKYKKIPELQVRLKNGKLEHRWETNVSGFTMPVGLRADGKEFRIIATNSWQTSDILLSDVNSLDIQREKYYVWLDKQ